jgi:hypothetical protein
MYNTTPNVQKNSIYPDAGHPDQLGLLGKFIENATKLTCLEITSYHIKCSTVLCCLELQARHGPKV